MKRKIFTLLFFSHALLLTGQNTFNVQSDFGFPFIFLRNVLPTDSCYYVTGVITDTTNQQYAIGSVFIKFGLDGEALLVKKLANPEKWYQPWLGGLHPTSTGNLAGCADGSDSLMKAMFIVFDTAGDTVLTREYINPNYPNESFITAACLERLGNDRFYMLGGYNPDSTYPQGNIYLLKLDEAGNVLQQKTYGSATSTEVAGSLLVEKDGGVIVGSCKSNYNLVWENFYKRAHVFKVDSLGNVVWEYLSPGGQLWDVAHSMVRSPDGGLVIASGRGIEHPINSSNGQLRWHGYIFKLDVDHQFVWGREMRGSRHSGATALTKVVASTDGVGYVAYGRLVETQSDTTEHFGSWIVKVSNQGDSLWARYYTFFDSLYRSPDPADFKSTPDGGYVVVGNTDEGHLDFGWIMKLDSFGCLVPGCNANDGPNAAPVQEQGHLSLAIYPNPTADYLNFELRGERPLRRATFRILDSLGHPVGHYHSSSPGDTFIVPVREWAAGTYYLQYLEDGEVKAVERFVVAR